MQAGFGFLEAGFVRSKNVVNIMAENLMDTTATTVGFIIAGFGIMFGSGNDFFGTEWFFLTGATRCLPRIDHPDFVVLFLPVCLFCRGFNDCFRLDGRTHRFQSRPGLQLFHRSSDLPDLRSLGLGRRLVSETRIYGFCWFIGRPPSAVGRKYIPGYIVRRPTA